MERHCDLYLCLTETYHAGAYEHLCQSTCGSQLDCVEFTWPDLPSTLGPIDLLVGSDLVYSAETARLLTAAIARLLRGSGVAATGCLYAHTAERWGASGYDAALLDCLRAERLHAQPVAGDAVEDDAPIEQRTFVFNVIALPETAEVGDQAAE